MPTSLTQRYAEALLYAASAHEGQLRKGTDIPYVAHLIGVSSLVLDGGGDEDVAIAALLHDVAEDQGGHARLEDIRLRFGDRIAGIVEECSDSLTEDPQAKAPWSERKEAYITHLPLASSDALLVTAADKLHNARAIHLDLLVYGSSVWKRFKGTSEQILWYYRSVLSVLEQRQVSPVLTAALQEEITSMEEWVE